MEEPAWIGSPVGPTLMTTLALQLMQVWLHARSAALVIRPSNQAPRLVTSESIDQDALDDIHRLCLKPPRELKQGVAYRGRLAHDFLAIPWLVGDDLRAVAYLVVSPEAVRGRHARYTRSLGDVIALSLIHDGAAATVAWPPEWGDEECGTAASANLVFQLERHEWNVARVARAMGVTRMTVYNRMRRTGVPRKHIARSPKRRRNQGGE